MVFEQQWAGALLAGVLSQLRDEASSQGSVERFERLQGFLTGKPPGTRQSQIAQELGMSVGAVRVAIHRLRRRFGRVLREQIAQTVADPEQVDDEISYLLTVLNL